MTCSRSWVGSARRTILARHVESGGPHSGPYELTEAEQKHDCYSRLYKQYTIDWLRLAIFARALLTNPRVREYLGQRHPEIATRFEAIIAEAKG